jgi:hypothetical protein
MNSNEEVNYSTYRDNENHQASEYRAYQPYEPNTSNGEGYNTYQPYRPGLQYTSEGYRYEMVGEPSNNVPRDLPPSYNNLINSKDESGLQVVGPDHVYNHDNTRYG